MSVENHAPDSPFGCAHHWGPRIGGRAFTEDALRHICNLASGHGGDCACKCGDTAKPVPGPPSPPRCLECGGGGMRRHDASCSVGQANDAHWDNVSVVTDAIKAALEERRTDREFMARLRSRIEADRTILERLADG